MQLSMRLQLRYTAQHGRQHGKTVQRPPSSLSCPHMHWHDVECDERLISVTFICHRSTSGSLKRRKLPRRLSAMLPGEM